MRSESRLLVIGPRKLSETVERALPQFQIVSADNPLAGVWQAGQAPFDALLVAVSAEGDILQVLQSLRELVPQARIILTCEVGDEPVARRALRYGADDYILQPLAREDVESAFGVRPPRRAPLPGRPAAPSVPEINRLAELMESLGDGVEPTLERLARLLADTFEAGGALVQVDDDVAVVGDVDQLVLEEPISRRGTVVGKIALAARRGGEAFAASDAARVADYAGLVDAVVQQARDRAAWRELAWTDDLSGLRNRRYFDKALGELIQSTSESRARLTVFIFDIDGFKSYNDKFGHAAGDGLIREVGQLLTRCTRETDVVARYGGDEFAVIFWDAEQPRVAGSEHPSSPSVLADRFCKVIRAHEFKGLGVDAPGPVTISGGLASFPWDGRTAADIVRAADDALFAAKKDGRNRIALAGESVCQATEENLNGDAQQENAPEGAPPRSRSDGVGD